VRISAQAIVCRKRPIGNFRVGVKATYIQKYNVDDQGYAGHFDRVYGNLPRWRGLANVDWNWGAFNVAYQAQYIGALKIGNPEGLGASANADPGAPGEDLFIGQPYHYGSYIYHNLSFGYNLEPLNTLVQLGVDNLADKQPPIFYMQNVANANTDVSTYDPVGRFYWAKITVKF
jgi:hypothetical protein